MAGERRPERWAAAAGGGGGGGSAVAASSAGNRAAVGERDGRTARRRPGATASSRRCSPGGCCTMITKRTKIQLLVFVVITLLGVSFVGAQVRPARPARHGRDYTVTAHFPDSGGIFSGAEVTYRGVTIGRVGTMKLTSEGVDVDLEIEKDQDTIPADTKALVGNRSAVGEQYVELQPQADGEPYLEDGLGDRRSPTPRSRSRRRSGSATPTRWSTRCRSRTCAPSCRSSARRSRTAATTSAGSSTARRRSSRPPTRTSTSPTSC